MIVCAVDDLIFSIKLSTAARHLGAALFFERKASQIVSTVREKRPSLVIFDLNSRTLAPLEAIAAIKGDPELRAVPIVGFVAHVDHETVTAARAAGADQVMARSAFVERLPELLRPSGNPETPDPVS